MYIQQNYTSHTIAYLFCRDNMSAVKPLRSRGRGHGGFINCLCQYLWLQPHSPDHCSPLFHRQRGQYCPLYPAVYNTGMGWRGVGGMCEVEWGIGCGWWGGGVEWGKKLVHCAFGNVWATPCIRWDDLQLKKYLSPQLICCHHHFHTTDGHIIQTLQTTSR